MENNTKKCKIQDTTSNQHIEWCMCDITL